MKLIILLLLTSCCSQRVVIKPNNLIAKVAGAIHHNTPYAVTIGKTIRISCSAEEFLSDTPWVNHEATHILQYRRYGTIGFIRRYLFFSITKGYYNNPLEMEAINHE